MELLHVILEALGFSLCLGGMILLYARICMQHRNIERINGKLDMIRLHDLKRIREEMEKMEKTDKDKYEKMRDTFKKPRGFDERKHCMVFECVDIERLETIYKCSNCDKELYIGGFIERED